MPAQHVLVVGGTGILAPAVLALAARGHRVGILARGREQLDAMTAAVAARGGAAHAIAADAHRPGTLDRVLATAVATHGPIALALAYLPTAPDDAVRALAAHVEGRLVHVLTTAWAAPGTTPEARAARAIVGGGGAQVVLLGWTGPPGAARWHTPEEVSSAVLAAADRPSREVLVGRVRPWEDRPR